MNCCPSPAHSESHKTAPSSGWKWLVGGARTGFLSSFTPFVRKAQTKLRGGPGSAVPVFTWGAGSWGAGQAASGEPPCCTGFPQSSGLSSPSNETGCKDQSPWEKQGSQSTVMKTASHRLEETSRPEPTLEKIKQAFDRLSTCRSLQSTVLLPKTSQPDTDGEIEQAMECGRGVRESSRPPAALIST